jgi:GNAT superfamily N-acetyltransferase
MGLSDFEADILKPWTRRLGCSLRILSHPGTTLQPIERNNTRQSWSLSLWHVGPHTVVQAPSALRGLIRALLSTLPPQHAVNAEDLAGNLGTDTLATREITHFHYMNPTTFQGVDPPDGFRIKTLKRDDRFALSALQAACEPEAIDEAEVSVDDTIGMACLQGDRIIAVATGFWFLSFMDIGVLTHPKYRQQGLGAAVVTTLAEWCRVRGIVAQYRYAAQNTGSRRLAEKLHFEHVIWEESLEVRR